jgi:hypothetical protein
MVSMQASPGFSALSRNDRVVTGEPRPRGLCTGDLGDLGVVGYVFLSYARTDLEYVRQLAAAMARRQLPTWYDHEIESGSRWVQVIEARVRRCSAFIPIVTPASSRSEWCERELTLADRLGKPILPLLLEGELPLILITRQYEDVSGGLRPTERWFATAARTAGETYVAPAAKGDSSAQVRASNARSVAPNSAAPAKKPFLPRNVQRAVNFSIMDSHVKRIADPAPLTDIEVDRILEFLDLMLTRPDDSPNATAVLRDLRQRPDLGRDVYRRIDSALRNHPGAR